MHAGGAFPAGSALAAGLVADELHEVLGHVDHAAALVHDHHAARAHHGAQLLQLAVVGGHVQVLLGDAAAAGAADLHGLDLVALGRAAADGVDHLAQRDAHRHLYQAGVADPPAQGEDLGAGGVADAEVAEPFGPVAQDAGDVGQGLDVVEHGGHAVQTGDRRVRRPRPGHPPSAFDAGQDGRLFAADESAGALLDGDVEVGEAAQDVGPKEPGRAALGDGVLQALDGQRVLGPAVDVALGGPDGVRGDEHALDDPEGVALQDGAVHEGARVALVGVADEVLLGGRGVQGDLPLLPGGEARAAPSAKPGLR